MRTLIKNIKELVQVERQPKLRVCGKDMAQMETIKNAYLIIEDDKFAAFGPMSELKEQRYGTHGAALLLRLAHAHRLCQLARA